MADPTDHMNVDATPGNNLVGDGSDYEIADPNDVLFARRDDDGNPMPVAQKIPGREQAFRVIPPTEGFYNEFLKPDISDDNKKVAEMLSKGFPDLDVDAEDVEKGLLIFGLETAEEMLQRAGGYDMYSALQEQSQDAQMQQMKQMMQAMGVSSEDMTLQEFFSALEDFEGEEAEGSEGDQQPQGGMSPGPARGN